MKRTIRPALLLLVPLVSAGGLAYAGGDEGAYQREACACQACELAASDFDVLFEKAVAGELPATFCDGTPETMIETTREHPAMFFAHAFEMRRDELPRLMEQACARFAEATTTKEQKLRLLDLVAFFPKVAGEHAVPALWSAAPQLFTTGHMLAFGEGAPATLRAEIERRAGTDVCAAAWLLQRGDDRGAELLEATIRGFDGSGCPGEAITAAVGLGAAGRTEATSGLRVALRDASLAALDGSDVTRARDLAVSIEFLDQMTAYGKRAPVAWMPSQLGTFCRERAAELTSAEQVFHLLETLES